MFQPAAFTPDVPATPARPDPLAVFAETESRDADTLKKDRNIASVFSPPPSLQTFLLLPLALTLLPYSLKLSLAMLTRCKKDRNIASVFQPAAFTPDVPATPARPDPLAVFAELSLAMLTRSKDAISPPYFSPPPSLQTFLLLPLALTLLPYLLKLSLAMLTRSKKTATSPPYFSPPPSLQTFPPLPLALTLLPYSLKLSLAMLTRSKRDEHRLHISARRLHSRRSRHSRSP